MKVCTDACLFGAFIANRITKDVKNILDIGTGTGLLALMLAQKSNATIDAVELNLYAASQAKENFTSSPWANKIKLFNTSIQHFFSSKKYDLIICNPPFFENDLQSPDEEKNEAKHDRNLSLKQLVHALERFLSDEADAAVLIPYQRLDYFKTILAEAGLFINEVLLVKQSPEHDFFRAVLLLSKKAGIYKETHLTIHDEQQQYSPEFTILLKDYYLNL